MVADACFELDAHLPLMCKSVSIDFSVFFRECSGQNPPHLFEVLLSLLCIIINFLSPLLCFVLLNGYIISHNTLYLLKV